VKYWLILACISLTSVSLPAQAADNPGSEHSAMHSSHTMHSTGMHTNPAVTDKRISLGLGPMQKQHQLSNMRSHLKAVQDIVGMIAENRFDEASLVAHEKLGLTPEMQQMCNMFDNQDFRAMGLAFHRSADELGDTLKSKDPDQSLRALHRTMNYCIQCHASYRQ